METSMKPRAVTVTACLMVILTAMAWLAKYMQGKLDPEEIVFLALFSAVAFKIIHAYWAGRRWARQVAMVTSIMILCQLFVVKDYGGAEGMRQLGQISLSIFLLFYLNGHEGRAYFRALYRDDVTDTGAVTSSNPSPSSI
jgi:hypothetical protein